MVIPKWTRFEHAFKSSVAYTNPLQEVTLKVRFTSPLGDTHEVYGFWDGGKTWRVRFSPDQPGRWTFQTACSDPFNGGLENEIGAFLCTAPLEFTPFQAHGPVQLSRDHRRFEHADGTPFFWLADTTWKGLQRASSKEWELYAKVRPAQGFSVVQCSVAPGADAHNQSAFTGPPHCIAISPAFFKRLDAKIVRLSRAGMLSAIAPLLELDSEAGRAALADDQAALLVRYVVARWGAEPVAWLLAFDADTQGKMVGRWKKLGQAVFAGVRHAPVVLYPGANAWVLDEFRDQPWVDAFALQTVTDMTGDALKWTFAGPFPKEWSQKPLRPVIPVAPCENGFIGQSKKRFSSDDVRHAVYWSLLLTAPAGVSYAGQGVVDWDTAVGAKTDKTLGAQMPMWEKAMFMPAAKQMWFLRRFLGSVDSSRLRPQPALMVTQPGDAEPSHYVAASGTEGKDLALVYVAQGRTVDVMMDAMPPSPGVSWFNPRTGGTAPAVAVVAPPRCQLPTPDAGDWVLVIRAGK